MIHDLAIAFFAGLGTGGFAALVTLIILYRRAGPEYPPREPVQRDP